MEYSKQIGDFVINQSINKISRSGEIVGKPKVFTITKLIVI